MARPKGVSKNKLKRSYKSKKSRSYSASLNPYQHQQASMETFSDEFRPEWTDSPPPGHRRSSRLIGRRG